MEQTTTSLIREARRLVAEQGIPHSDMDWVVTTDAVEMRYWGSDEAVALIPRTLEGELTTTVLTRD